VIAEHGNKGTLGCFLDTKPRREGTVQVMLYERRAAAEQLARILDTVRERG
jgi:hypothetical protein